MTSHIVPVDPFDLVVFGGTGDLARRKLLPALYHRFSDGQFDNRSRIIGVSRSDYTNDAFKSYAREAIELHIAEDERDNKILETFIDLISYVQVDAIAENGWSDLKTHLGDDDKRIRAFYLAVSPDIYGPICQHINDNSLMNSQTRVVVEKPIGKDLSSAIVVNDAVGQVFDESQIYRIDHYLGKETVQNLMALRFANSLFEPQWNAAHIDHIQITVSESLGVEGRAGYYDTSGAMRDMVQNHILQLLCLVAMEPPMSSDADAVRDEKLKVLKALSPIEGNTVSANTVRGQYAAGASASGAVPSYADELESGQSNTETFVAIKAEVNNWRWAGVPFYLRTGKRLANRMSEIVVSFRPIPHSIFDQVAGNIIENKLVIRLQPDEGVKLYLMIKDPGPGGMRLKQIPLDMSFEEAFGSRHPDAYERLLMDVIRGNATLFMRRDEVEAAWSWVDPILSAWQQSGEKPKSYTSGTWGPSASVAMIERDGRTWVDEAL
jgi:glucose-6-phosphate 1-dehydrogenase